MARLFGTDGIRGIANTEISCELAMDIAKAASIVVGEEKHSMPTFLVGRDTRISGEMIEAAMNAGFCSVGVNSVNLGVVPTPAVSYLVAEGYADCGVMISASHNPFEFNGIKIFGHGGLKLADEQEFEMEKIILDKIKPYPVCWKDQIGQFSANGDLLEKYINHLTETVSDVDLSSLRVAIDCSNGSSSRTAHKLFEQLGIKADIFHHTPDGVNINKDCGSTHINVLSEIVANGDYHCGFAFDGDADRCIMVDESGNEINGDIIMAILAYHLKQEGKLKNNTLVATVMSNMGLFKFAEENDINMEITKVGDRYVLEKILQGGHNFGGEQSGHVIMSDYMSTGDGQLTAIQILSALAKSGKKASELAKVMTVYPQAMKNIRANAEMKSALAVDPGAQKIIDEASKILGNDGRILVRPSGTEPLIRVMIEGKNQDKIDKLIDQVAEQIFDRLTLNQSFEPLTNL